MATKSSLLFTIRSKLWSRIFLPGQLFLNSKLARQIECFWLLGFKALWLIATFLAALNLVDILIFRRRSISRSPVFCQDFNFGNIFHLALQSSKRGELIRKWRVRPGGRSHLAFHHQLRHFAQLAFLRSLFRKYCPTIHPSYVTQSQNILILSGNYLNSIAWQKNVVGLLFLAASGKHWQKSKLCASHEHQSSIATRSWAFFLHR